MYLGHPGNATSDPRRAARKQQRLRGGHPVLPETGRRECPPGQGGARVGTAGRSGWPGFPVARVSRAGGLHRVVPSADPPDPRAGQTRGPGNPWGGGRLREPERGNGVPVQARRLGRLRKLEPWSTQDREPVRGGHTPGPNPGRRAPGALEAARCKNQGTGAEPGGASWRASTMGTPARPASAVPTPPRAATPQIASHGGSTTRQPGWLGCAAAAAATARTAKAGGSPVKKRLPRLRGRSEAPGQPPHRKQRGQPS